MKFKICAFNKSAYAESVESLISQLTTDYLDSSVSVKYIKKSGLVQVVFIDISPQGIIYESYIDKRFDFKELRKLAVVDFEVELVV